MTWFTFDSSRSLLSWALKRADSIGQLSLWCYIKVRAALSHSSLYLGVTSMVIYPMQFLMQCFFQKLQRVGGPGEATLLPVVSVSNAVRSALISNVLIAIIISVYSMSYPSLVCLWQMLSWIVDTSPEEKESQVFLSLFIVWRINTCLFNSHSNWKQKPLPWSKLFSLPTWYS